MVYATYIIINIRYYIRLWIFRYCVYCANTRTRNQLIYTCSGGGGGIFSFFGWCHSFVCGTNPRHSILNQFSRKENTLPKEKARRMGKRVFINQQCSNMCGMTDFINVFAIELYICKRSCARIHSFQIPCLHLRRGQRERHVKKS